MYSHNEVSSAAQSTEVANLSRPIRVDAALDQLFLLLRDFSLFLVSLNGVQRLSDVEKNVSMCFTCPPAEVTRLCHLRTSALSLTFLTLARTHAAAQESSSSSSASYSSSSNSSSSSLHRFASSSASSKLLSIFSISDTSHSRILLLTKSIAGPLYFASPK